MDIIVLIGRIVFVLLFLSSGVMGHFGQTEQMAGYAESKGVRPGRPLVQITGLMLVVGGLSILLGVWADLGALILAAFLVPTAFLMHAFWKEEGQAAMAEQVNFMKNMALAGAALILFAFFAYAGDDLGLTITGPLFEL